MGLCHGPVLHAGDTFRASGCDRCRIPAGLRAPSDDQQTHQRVDEVVRIASVAQAPLDPVRVLCLLIDVVSGCRVPASLIRDHPIQLLDLLLANISSAGQGGRGNEARDFLDRRISLLLGPGSIKPFQHVRIAYPCTFAKIILGASILGSS